MKNHKFTWVDGLVLAVILLLIAGTCVKFLSPKTEKAAEETEFTYQISVSGLRHYSVEAFQEGDAVYDLNGKGAVGVITAIDVSPAVVTIAKPDGTIQEGAFENRYDVVLTISAAGNIRDGQYEIGTYDITLNQMDTYFTKYLVWSGTVTALEEVDR